MRLAVGTMLSLLGLAACGGSSSTSPTSGSNPTGGGGGGVSADVITADYYFSPASITIKAGTTVKWANGGTTSHTITSDAGVSPAFDSGTLAPPGTTMDPYGGTTTTPGGSYTATFPTPGTYAYHCTFHGTTKNMTGTITVTP